MPWARTYLLSCPLSPFYYYHPLIEVQGFNHAADSMAVKWSQRRSAKNCKHLTGKLKHKTHAQLTFLYCGICHNHFSSRSFLGRLLRKRPRRSKSGDLDLVSAPSRYSHYTAFCHVSQYECTYVPKIASVSSEAQKLKHRARLRFDFVFPSLQIPVNITFIRVISSRRAT